MGWVWWWGLNIGNMGQDRVVPIESYVEVVKEEKNIGNRKTEEIGKRPP